MPREIAADGQCLRGAANRARCTWQLPAQRVRHRMRRLVSGHRPRAACLTLCSNLLRSFLPVPIVGSRSIDAFAIVLFRVFPENAMNSKELHEICGHASALLYRRTEPEPRAH